MGSIIVTSGNVAKRLAPGVFGWTDLGLKEIPDEYSSLCDRETSNRRFEEIVAMVGMPIATVKPEGQPVKLASFGQGIVQRADQVVYGTGFAMTHEVEEDDQYDAKLSEIGGYYMGRSMNALIETIVSNLYNNGFSSTGSNALADGQALFSASHNYGGVTFSNLSSAGALSEAVIEQMMIDVRNRVDNAGIRQVVMPKSIHVPIAIGYNAIRVFGAPVDMRPNNSANRDINALKYAGSMYGSNIPIVQHVYFSSSTAFFIRTDAKQSVMLFEREKMKGEEDNDFLTKNRIFTLTTRFMVMVGDPKGVQGQAGA